jgi:peptide/nickel transport system permease protein
LLIAVTLIFLVLQVLPGNVASVVLGQHATPASISAIDHSLGLNKPLVDRYTTFIGHLVSGHFGNSSAAAAQGVRLGVWQSIRVPLRNSVVLAALTLILFVPLCVVLAIAAAARAGRKTDHAISVVALAVGAMPEFLIGTLLIVVFFNELNLLPPVAEMAPGASPLSDPASLVLPILTLLLVGTAIGTRLLRASLIDVLAQDYIAIARLNGQPEPRVLFHYALRNALGPAVQVLAQMVQYLVGGLVIVESVFNYPGIGSKLVQAVSERDVQEVSVVCAVLAAIYIGVNIAADLAVVVLVPRLRTQL